MRRKNYAGMVDKLSIVPFSFYSLSQNRLKYGMLPFENRVHDYIENSNNHVMYRVAPVFEGDHLVAHGVFMEGYSVEDNGTGICFNVFCYNVQPYIEIDYADGISWVSEQSEAQPEFDVTKQNSKINIEHICSSVSAF